MQVPFYKMHGIGNDFIMTDSRAYPPATDLVALAQRLCDRHYGIGADGLIIYHPDQAGRYRMQILNADGSEAEMCGNGLRCFVRYLVEAQNQTTPEFEVNTLAGLMRATYDSETHLVSVDMGQPILAAEQIPSLGFTTSPVQQAPLQVGQRDYQVNLVSMGNPHCIIWVVRLEQVDLLSEGPAIETHPAFPRKTNVEFVQILNEHEARMAVWERGAGATLACGTGACAVLVAGVLGGRLARQATIELPGGSLNIRWDEASGHVHMQGSAEFVFTGSFDC